MVAGKFKLKTVNESPLMEISNTLGSPLHPNKKQLSLKSSLRKSKLRASEYSSKVKKSLIGYFPKSNNASSECQSAKPKVEGLQKLVNELLERQTELQSQLEMKKSELERLSDRIQMLEIEKGHFSNEISMASSLKMELFIAKSQIEELEKAQKSNKERETESKQLLRLNSELQNGTDDIDCHPWKAERYQPVYMRTGQNGIHETDHTEEYLQRQTTALPKPTEDTHMDAPNNVEKVPLVSCMEWVNANLRNEIHSSKSPSGKKGTEDSSVSLSSKSQPSCKQFLSGEKGVRQKSQRRGSDFEGLASFPSSTHDETGHSDDLKRTSYSSSTSETGQSDESKRLSSYSSSLSETGQSDDSNLERFEGLIGISRWARRKSKSKRALDRRDNWLLPHEDHSSVSSSPRHSFSLSDKSSNCNLPPHTGDYRHYHNKENNNADSEIRKASFSDIESHHLEKSRNCLPGKSNSKQKLLDDQHRSDGEVEELSKQSSDKSTKTESKWDKDNHIYKTFDETRKPLTSAPKRPSGAINFETDALQQLKHPAAIGRRPQRIPKPPPKPSWMPPPVNTLATGTKGIELASPTIPAFPPSSKVVPPPPPPPPPGSKVAPPPPPPPPPGSKVAPTPPALVQKQSMVNTMRRVPELVEFYHSLMKRDQKRDSCVSGTTDNSDVSNVRSNMIGEIENRSAYLLAIKNDVETQGEFVRSLIREVQAAHYTNIEDVVEFVKWLDEELSFLVDERAVLKHFEWPERKADALREAACGYSELKKIYSEVFSYEDDRHNSCNNSLKKMFALLERIEQKVDGFLQMRDMTMGRYKEFNIPYDWMLDNGIVRQIKLASVKLARMYMTRVTKELESRGSAEKESVNESLLCQGVRFAFRVHQFAGGFDAETMSAFEQMKKLGQMNHKH